MDVQFIGVVVFFLGVYFLVKGPELGFYIFISSAVLGSCAAAILTSVGNSTLQPAHLLLGFLTVSVLKEKQNWRPVIHCMTFPREGFWFVATALYGGVTAYLYPRIFAGSVYVNAIGVTEFGFPFIQVPLGPSSGNITQSVYFFGNVLCFLMCYTYARTEAGFRTLFNAMLLYCFMNIVFAILDIATFWTNTTYLLEFIRNSTYKLHNETVIYGLKRIVGSFTEASAFAYATIGILGFTLRLWLGGVRPALTLTLSVISALLIIFSTSSTAYAALPLLMAFVYGTSLVRAIREPVQTTTKLFLVFTPLFVVFVATAVMVHPTTSAVIKSFADTLLFDKSTSDSGLERASWNKAAISAFFSTYGLGAGVGSVRSSSFALAVIGNMGFVGTILYFTFIGLTLLRRDKSPIPEKAFEIRAACRTGCVGILISAIISGALIDLGLPFYIFAALATAAGEAPLKSIVQSKSAISPNHKQPIARLRPRFSYAKKPSTSAPVT